MYSANVLSVDTATIQRRMLSYGEVMTMIVKMMVMKMMMASDPSQG